jgi:predicted porin
VQGERNDATTRVTYDSRGSWTAYGFVQDTLSKTGNREDNNRVGTGGSVRVSDKLKVTGEASTGDLGGAGKLGTEYLYSDRTNLYLNYVVENESSDNGLQAKKGNMNSGFRTRYSDTTSVYMEERYAYGDVPTGLTHAAGVDVAATDRWNFGASVDVGTLRDNLTGAETKRNGVGARVGYGFDDIKIATAFEYRIDDTQSPDTAIFSERKSWLIKNSLKYQINPSWRFVGKLNHGESKSSEGNSIDGSYTEGVLGYGYRPIDNDRLNMLFKYTYFYNLPTPAQLTPTNQLLDTSSQLLQKSHVVAVDAMYDLTQRWSIGGKYAYRLGQVSVDRVNPEFFDSRASLYIARVDWQFIRHWDTLVEYRVLNLPDADDRRSGALVALYWHMGNNIKLGVGYNFTDFSDNLTDLSFKSQGVFINVIGKM